MGEGAVSAAQGRRSGEGNLAGCGARLEMVGVGAQPRASSTTRPVQRLQPAPQPRWDLTAGQSGVSPEARTLLCLPPLAVLL